MCILHHAGERCLPCSAAKSVSDDRASVQVHGNRHITYPVIAIASCRPDESIQHTPYMYGVPSAGYPYTFYCKPLLTKY